MYITEKRFQIDAYDLGVEYSKMNVDSNGLSFEGVASRANLTSFLTPRTGLLPFRGIAPGIGEFWASTGGRMAGYASC